MEARPGLGLLWLHRSMLRKVGDGLVWDGLSDKKMTTRGVGLLRCVLGESFGFARYHATDRTGDGAPVSSSVVGRAGSYPQVRSVANRKQDGTERAEGCLRSV